MGLAALLQEDKTESGKSLAIQKALQMQSKSSDNYNGASTEKSPVPVYRKGVLVSEGIYDEAGGAYMFRVLPTTQEQLEMGNIKPNYID